MLRKLALLLLPVAFLAAACSDGGQGSKSTTDNQNDEPAVVNDGQDADAVDDISDSTTDDDGSGDNVFLSDLSPFELLGSLGGQPSVGGVDASLEEALLDSDDLLSDFQSLGEFGATMPTEFGDIAMAANIFTTGDPASEDLADMGTMVMSGAFALPPDAVEDFQREAREVSEADLEELEAMAGDLAGLAQLEVLDASGLGDTGFGMGVTMDFAGLFGAFGAPADATEDAAIAMDAFVFLRDDRAYMVMVMWLDSASPEADARELAERIDQKAA